jgi:monolysocardiolipin acyltransferase
MCKPTTRTKLHPKHKGKEELQYWRADQKWYHPIICSSVVHLSRFILSRRNTLIFHGRERWDALFSKNNPWTSGTGRGLLSFSNHVSLFDDPLLISNLGKTKINEVRWIAADHKNFFGSNLKGIIYSGGRCVPIIRGGGLDQPGFDFLVDRLNNGEWVHIFPEGGRSRDKEHRIQQNFKIGIGKLMRETNPVVMPFYHYGMHEVLPIGQALPNSKKKVDVYFGTPTIIDEQWWKNLLQDAPAAITPHNAWKKAAVWTEKVLLDLENQHRPVEKSSTETTSEAG